MSYRLSMRTGIIKFGVLFTTLWLVTAHYTSPMAYGQTSGLIAYETRVDRNWEIFVMNEDGSNPVNITNNPFNDYMPEWSPDGSQIVFLSNRDRGRELYVMNADGSGVYRLTYTEMYHESPAWSPDGARIAFACEGPRSYDICVINVDGSGLQNLTENSELPDGEFDPEWSADGNYIYFSASPNSITFGRAGFIMNADGTNLYRFMDGYSAEVDVSPDGSRIVYEGDLEDFELYVANSDGSNPYRLTQHPRKDAD